MSTRHSWIKLKLHNYLCRKCGTGRRNARDEQGGWFATFHTASGERIVSAVTPPCEPGRLTAERLEWLAARTEATA